MSPEQAKSLFDETRHTYTPPQFQYGTECGTVIVKRPYGEIPLSVFIEADEEVHAATQLFMAALAEVYQASNIIYEECGIPGPTEEHKLPEYHQAQISCLWQKVWNLDRLIAVISHHDAGWEVRMSRWPVTHVV
jgi:hypothetical protein